MYPSFCFSPSQATAAAVAEPEPEVLFERLANPSRVTFSQQRVLAVDAAQRYVPLVTALKHVWSDHGIIAIEK